MVLSVFQDGRSVLMLQFSMVCLLVCYTAEFYTVPHPVQGTLRQLGETVRQYRLLVKSLFLWFQCPAKIIGPWMGMNWLGFNQDERGSNSGWRELSREGDMVCSLD